MAGVFADRLCSRFEQIFFFCASSASEPLNHAARGNRADENCAVSPARLTPRTTCSTRGRDTKGHLSVPAAAQCTCTAAPVRPPRRRGTNKLCAPAAIGRNIKMLWKYNESPKLFRAVSFSPAVAVSYFPSALGAKHTQHPEEHAVDADIENARSREAPQAVDSARTVSTCPPALQYPLIHRGCSLLQRRRTETQSSPLPTRAVMSRFTPVPGTVVVLCIVLCFMFVCFPTSFSSLLLLLRALAPYCCVGWGTRRRGAARGHGAALLV